MNLYKTLEEKNKFFNQITIEDENSLADFFELKFDKSIWRGQNHSGLKILTTLQRAYFNGKLKNISAYDLITNLNKKIVTYNYKFFVRYFLNLGLTIEDPNLTLMSLARHYDCYSPMLDFTSDKMVAVYFASQELTGIQNIETDKYFSIYLIKETRDFDIRNCKVDELEIALELEKINKDLGATNAIMDEELKRRKAEERALAINPWFKILTAYKETKPEFKNNFSVFFINDNITETLKFYLNVNANIVAQEGVFIFNTYPDKSLEEVFHQGVRSVSTYDEYNGHIIHPQIDCYNINRKFIKSIQNHLKNNGYTDETLFPDFKKIMPQIQQQLLYDLS